VTENKPRRGPAIQSALNLKDTTMTEAAKNLSMQARKLSPVERLELVDDLLASLDESDPKIDGLWAKEAEDRLAAYRRGEIKAVPLQEVLAKYRVA
jgi:putative addiction module component (TIGR02574 family)